MNFLQLVSVGQWWPDPNKRAEIRIVELVQNCGGLANLVGNAVGRKLRYGVQLNLYVFHEYLHVHVSLFQNMSYKCKTVKQRTVALKKKICNQGHN